MNVEGSTNISAARILAIPFFTKILTPRCQLFFDSRGWGSCVSSTLELLTRPERCYSVETQTPTLTQPIPQLGRRYSTNSIGKEHRNQSIESLKSTHNFIDSELNFVPLYEEEVEKNFLYVPH